MQKQCGRRTTQGDFVAAVAAAAVVPKFELLQLTLLMLLRQVFHGGDCEGASR